MPLALSYKSLAVNALLLPRGHLSLTVATHFAAHTGSRANVAAFLTIAASGLTRVDAGIKSSATLGTSRNRTAITQAGSVGTGSKNHEHGGAKNNGPHDLSSEAPSTLKCLRKLRL
jgi:hypothetical protein